MIFNFWSFCPYNPQMLWLKVDSTRHFVSCWILSLGLCDHQATLPPTELHLRHYFWNKQKICMLCEVTEAWTWVWHHPLNVRWLWSHLLNVWGLIWDLRIYSPCLKAPWKENVVWGVFSWFLVQPPCSPEIGIFHCSGIYLWDHIHFLARKVLSSDTDGVSVRTVRNT